MSEDWNFYPLFVEDEPASIFLDIGIGKAPPIHEYPTMVWLRLYMQSPRPDGLSSQEEFDVLREIESELDEALKHRGRSLYVGRNTSGGTRDFFIYSGDPEIETQLSTVMSQWPDYAFETGQRPDAEWSTYWNFLYPSPEDLQRMGNRDVVANLVEHSDDLTAVRPIDHFAMFPTQLQARAFASDMEAERFVLANPVHMHGQEWHVALQRPDIPDDIDNITIPLFRAAIRHGGAYDGWGCPVVSPKPH